MTALLENLKALTKATEILEGAKPPIIFFTGVETLRPPCPPPFPSLPPLVTVMCEYQLNLLTQLITYLAS